MEEKENISSLRKSQCKGPKSQWGLVHLRTLLKTRLLFQRIKRKGEWSEERLGKLDHSGLMGHLKYVV